jgi:hypothetical protein
VIISTQKKGFHKGHIEVYRDSVDEQLEFHQLKRNFNQFDKFYLEAQKFPRFTIHEYNAHIGFLSISCLKYWDVIVREEIEILPWPTSSMRMPGGYLALISPSATSGATYWGVLSGSPLWRTRCGLLHGGSCPGLTKWRRHHLVPLTLLGFHDRGALGEEG